LLKSFILAGMAAISRWLSVATPPDRLVYLWPHEVARRKQPPLVLRLIEIKNERGTMYLATNVLSECVLSLRQAARLYTLRWGIELQFRGVKQTFGRGKLRSRKAEHALAELNWSFVALAMVQLLALREQIKVDIPPAQTSVAQAIRAIRHAMDYGSDTATGTAKLTTQLRAATKDRHHRSHPKASRYRVNYKDKPTTTQPIILKATVTQKQNYRAMSLAS
jgi:hypothetical protein